ncbi:MAG: hypothetical protein K940chlam8_01078 [Chlamydiae bacterium]|nr:hypothetical protein [Chlamydiota bacterium]
MDKKNNSQPDDDLELIPGGEPRYDPSQTFMTFEMLEEAAKKEKPKKKPPPKS